MVNVPEITALADYLEKLPDERFLMESFAKQNECGTCACIAGWDVIRRGGSVEFLGGNVSFRENGEKTYPEISASSALGLSITQADNLFTPDGPEAHVRAAIGNPSFISRRRAIAVLRDMARRRSGDADWSIRDPQEAA